MRAMMTFLIEAQEPGSAARTAAMGMPRYGWDAETLGWQQLDLEPLQPMDAEFALAAAAVS
jgi:hypothetical protein